MRKKVENETVLQNNQRARNPRACWYPTAVSTRRLHNNRIEGANTRARTRYQQQICPHTRMIVLSMVYWPGCRCITLVHTLETIFPFVLDAKAAVVEGLIQLIARMYSAA